MNLKELTAKIGFEVDEGPLHKLETTLEGIKTRLELFAGAEAIKKLFELSEHFAEWGENLNITANNLGITTDALQRWSIAAQRSGVSTEEMSHGLAILGKHIFDAKNGSVEAANALQKAGFSGSQIAGFKNGEDALLALSDKLNAIQDPMQRMAVAQELLGRGGYRMVGFLSQGSKAIQAQGEAASKLGLILSKGQVEALEKTAHAFQQLWGLMRGIGASIASFIGPAFITLVNSVTRLYTENKKLIDVNIHNWLLNIAYGMGVVYGLIWGVTKRVIEFAKSWGLSAQILPILGKIAGAVGAIISVLGALRIAGGVFQFLAGAMTPVNAMLLLLVFTASELYRAFSGQQTLVAQFLEWIGVLKYVNNLIDAFIESFAKLFDAASNAVDGIIDLFKGFQKFSFKDFFSGLGTDVLDKIKMIGNAFADWVTGLTPVKLMLEYLSTLFDKFTSLKGLAGGFLDKVGIHIPGLSSPETAMAPTANAAATTVANTNTASASTVNTINVNVAGSNASPAAIGDATAKALKDHSEYQNRNAAKSVPKGKAY